MRCPLRVKYPSQNSGNSSSTAIPMAVLHGEQTRLMAVVCRNMQQSSNTARPVTNSGCVAPAVAGGLEANCSPQAVGRPYLGAAGGGPSAFIADAVAMPCPPAPLSKHRGYCPVGRWPPPPKSSAGADRVFLQAAHHLRCAALLSSVFVQCGGLW